MAGMLLSQMDDWYGQELARVNAQVAAANAARASQVPTVAGSATGATQPLDPTGAAIGRYYTGAMAADPRMPAIQRNISGAIAPDVRRQIAQAAAERGVGIGSYGGGADTSGLLRALGLTSMDLTNRGIAQYGDMYSAVPKLQPESLFITPAQQAEMAMKREALSREIAANQALQTQRIAAEERMQNARMGSEERRAFSGIQSAAQSAAADRAAKMKGAQSTDNMLSSMISRLSSPAGTAAETRPTTTSVATQDWNKWISGIADQQASNWWNTPQDVDFTGYLLGSSELPEAPLAYYEQPGQDQASLWP